VRHYEVDPYGHVNHANYIHYLEVARVEALDTLGLALGEMRRLGYLIVATGLTVRFHAPAHSGDTLEILTHIRDIHGARTQWIQEVRSAADQRVLVTAEVTGAFVTEAGRPVRIPEAFRAKLSPLHVPDAAARA
jgi:acyl-CoA thioester hydrolase